MGRPASPEGWPSRRASEAGTLVAMDNGVTLKGRERELASLQRVLEANGPRVAFVYGVAGIGKSALLDSFASGVQGSGTPVWRGGRAARGPTGGRFSAGPAAAGGRPGGARGRALAHHQKVSPPRPGVG